jgi:hypothetical protein
MNFKSFWANGEHPCKQGEWVVLGGLDGMKTFIIHHQWGINQHEGQLALGVCV